MKKSELRQLIREELGRLREIDFSSKESFTTYQKAHKMRPETQVTVAGNKMSVGQASKETEAPTKTASGKSNPTKKVDLKMKPGFKYANIANRWLDDQREFLRKDGKTTLRYQVAHALLSGEKDPSQNVKLNLDDPKEYRQYASILRGLDSIVSSDHEMSWRTDNYSIGDGEKWAKESLKKVFTQ